MKIHLDQKTVASLTLPEGKKEDIAWDTDLARFGVRLRRSGGRILRSFITQYRRAGTSPRITLGPADVLTVEQARAAARKLLAKVELGEDPAGARNERRQKDAITFKAVAAEYLAAKGDELRPTTFRASKAYLTGPYFKPLHALPVDRISRRDVAARLVAIARENGKPAAGQARSKLSAMLAWGMRAGLVDSNVTIGTEQPKANPARDRILSDQELAAVWRACDGIGDFSAIVRLLILLPVRRQEIGGACWSEFSDLSGPAPSWTLPAARAKNHRSITLPLLPMALAIITSVPRRVTRDQLFGLEHPRGFCSWDRAKKALDAKLDIAPWGLHDLRRTHATRSSDLGTPPHIIETLLNHWSGVRGGISQIYNKSTYSKEITQALGLWEDHIRALGEGGGRKVVALRTS